MAEKLVIAVDFDGTVVAHEYPRIGRPVPHALEYLRKWRDQGARIVLWTMRSEATLAAAVQYLREAGIELYGVNENPSQRVWTNSPKAYAHVYLDDAALGCPLMRLKDCERPVVDWLVAGPMVDDLLRQY